MWKWSIERRGRRGWAVEPLRGGYRGSLVRGPDSWGQPGSPFGERGFMPIRWGSVQLMAAPVGISPWPPVRHRHCSLTPESDRPKVTRTGRPVFSLKPKGVYHPLCQVLPWWSCPPVRQHPEPSLLLSSWTLLFLLPCWRGDSFRAATPASSWYCYAVVIRVHLIELTCWCIVLKWEVGQGGGIFSGPGTAPWGLRTRDRTACFHESPWLGLTQLKWGAQLVHCLLLHTLWPKYEGWGSPRIISAQCPERKGEKSMGHLSY